MVHARTESGAYAPVPSPPVRRLRKLAHITELRSGQYARVVRVLWHWREFLACAVALFASMATAAGAPTTEIPLYGTMEVALRAAQEFDGAAGRPNPFTEVSFAAHVTSPSGRSFAVPGFFDGDGNGGNRGDL